MKNLAKSAVLVVALGAMCLTSCTKNEDPAGAPKAFAGEKTNVQASFTVQGQGSKTGKTVNGGLYAWINEIDIVTKSNDFAYAPFLTPFIMTGDAIGTVEANGDVVVGNYTLNNVALGSNDFTITTKCNTDQVLSFETTTMTATARMALLKAKNPYAIYGASVLGQNVVKGANVLPATMLTTTQGRACAVFTMAPALTQLGVTAHVSAAPSVPSPQGLPTLTLNSTTNGSFYWSNVVSTGGTSIVYTVDLYDNNNHKFNTFTATMNVTNSNSVNTIYTISESDITTNTEVEAITAQPWTNTDGGSTIGN